jgi:hypothetical protein
VITRKSLTCVPYFEEHHLEGLAYIYSPTSHLTIPPFRLSLIDAVKNFEVMSKTRAVRTSILTEYSLKRRVRGTNATMIFNGKNKPR